MTLEKKSRSWCGTGNKNVAGSNWLMGSQFTLSLLILVIGSPMAINKQQKASTDLLPLKKTTYFFSNL